MNIADRYWCHLCRGTSPIYIFNGTKKCQICDSDFVELIEYPNYNRFSSIRLVINEGDVVSNNQLGAFIEMVRSIEDRNIMELRENSQMENVTQQTFEEDLDKEREKNPISKEYFASLKEVILSDKEIKQTCSICQGTFEKELKGIKLGCKHIFHTECIAEWFKTSNRCPCCRYEFPAEN